MQWLVQLGLSSSLEKRNNVTKRLDVTTIIGIALLIMGGLIVIRVFFPVLKAEIKYQASVPSAKEVHEIVPVDREFGLVIPKIEANSKIIANVDPYSPEEYQIALSKGVAHARGSSLPGKSGNIFLFSHSSSDFLNAQIYNSVFYLISKLQPGDQLKIYYKQQEYLYSVKGQKIVDPSEIHYLTDTNKTETLTLMTCWPPGTTIKRLIVQAERKPVN